MKSAVRRISALASMLVALASPALAFADGPGESRKNGLGGLLDEARSWLTAASAGPMVASEPTRPASAHPRGVTADPADPDRVQSTRKPLLDYSPHASIIARDWRGSLAILGSRSMLVDDLRPTASSRMLLGRVATDARLTFFAQAGVGEWRIDPVMFPTARSHSETAGQFGCGFELNLGSGMRMASEAQYTMIYRALTYTPDEVAPRMASFVFALDGRF